MQDLQDEVEKIDQVHATAFAQATDSAKNAKIQLAADFQTERDQIVSKTDAQHK